MTNGPWARAQAVIPGGVNSPVRSFRSVGGEPFFVDRGEGAHLYDTRGRRYVDYVLSWGPLILGHAHPVVTEALGQQLDRGTSYGAPTEAEVELAERIVRLVPTVEMVRLVNSGTEATMTALRLARATTGRPLVLKFTGCYHGHADAFLVAAGSGVATLGLPDSPGVSETVAAETLVLPFNDLAAVETLFGARGNDISSVFVEPVVGNSGLIPPVEGFLEGLRTITERHGTLLVFDEVMTGFRVALGGAQERYGIEPDLTTLGKVIGGGLPVGAFGGRRDLMEQIAPAGPVYQAGTLSGNPLATAAGNAQLRYLDGPCGRATVGWCRVGACRSGDPGHWMFCRIDVGGVFQPGAHPFLRGGAGRRPRHFSGFPSGVPPSRCVSCPVSFRGRVRIHGAYVRRYRREPRSCAGGGKRGCGTPGYVTK